MAFFKFRKGGDDQAATAQQPESIEALRKRAKHRLIGTAVLVLIGVIGFPLLVDKQPRPVDVDIPLEIPDKAKVKPLSAAVPVVPASQPAVAVPAASEAAASAPVQPEGRDEAKPETRPQSRGEAGAPVDEGARAQALLEGKPTEKPVEKADKPADKPADKAADKGRFVVQVGAFAETDKAREVRLKVERAGLKTYTHVAETKDGRRIRVRVGPFTSRAEAEKAADRIKKLELPAIILTL